MIIHRLAIHLVNLIAIGSVGESDIQHISITLGLIHPLSITQFIALGFNDGEFHTAIYQHIVSLTWFPFLRLTNLTFGKIVLRRYSATFQDAPSCSLQLRVDLV